MNLDYEKKLFLAGHKFVGGIDEAGRGPLAGPVVAVCVVLNSDFCIKDELGDVKDSKKMTAKKREELHDIIIESCSDVGVGVCDHETIDRINILEATFLAMKKSLGALKIKPNFVLIDGKFPIPNTSVLQEPVIKGDSFVFSVAAASIVAKVARDRLMQKYHEEYEVYGFDKHKGYGTKKHMDALRKHGPCPIHRQSFKPVKRCLS